MGNLCPVCKKKIYDGGIAFDNHVEACAARVGRSCPACGGDLTRVHKAEEKITTVECVSGECEFQLELFSGGKVN